MTTLAHELEILAAVDPGLSNTDDYPIYRLKDATVSCEGGGKAGGNGNGRGKGRGKGKGGKEEMGVANLLEASGVKVLRIEGRLESVGREWRGNVLKKPFKPTHIEVTSVQRFAYGSLDSGEVVIWGLGQAGWFEISPSKEYEGVYADMVEAVEMLFFMADVYNEPRKRGGGPNAELVFREYAEDERFECQEPEQAAEIFRKHRAFLISRFLNRAEGIAWTNTPIYRYVKKEYAEDLAVAKARMEGRLDQIPAETPKTSTAVLPQRSAQPASATAKRKPETPSTLKKDGNWWESAVIFEFMQKAVNHGAMHRNRITVSKVAKLMTKRYEIDDEEMAHNVIMVHATNLHYMMENPRRKNIAYFASEPIFQELANGHSLPAAEIRRAEAIELRPRKDHSSLKDEATSDSDSSSSAATPKRRQRASKKGQLSVLRPKSSKYSGKSGKGKGKGVKRGKSHQPNGDIITEAQTDEEEAEESSNDGIDTPTQAFSPGKRKLLHEDDEDDRPLKRTASASIEPASPPASSSSEDDDPSTTTETLPLRWRPGNSKATQISSAALAPAIITTPLPTYTPNGPGDSWICAFDGCKRKIYGASTELGRGLIKEHLEDHERGRERVVGIVLGEEQRLRLPVNNLIKRIREMTEAQTPLFPSMGPAAVSPIGRRD